MEWFEKRGVPLKIEDDGRIFPESNSSQTIIDCFLYEAKKLGVEVIKQQVVTEFNKDEFWQVKTRTMRWIPSAMKSLDQIKIGDLNSERKDERN